MRAIILAAGAGSRLRPKTLDRPKCLVKFAGKTLLDYQLASLQEAGLEEVTVVTGYRAEAIEARVANTRHNPRWASTNMVASLMVAADLLDGTSDLLVAYSDIVYEASILRALRQEPAALAVAVDLAWEALWRLRFQNPMEDAETLKMDSHGLILNLGQRPSAMNEIEGQYMGLVKIGANLAPRLVALWNSLDPQGQWEGRNKELMFMTTFLQLCIHQGLKLKAVPIRGGWFEVDSLEDLALYEDQFRRGQLDSFCRLPIVKD